MKTTEEAKRLVAANAEKLDSTMLALNAATGFANAENIFSPIDFPTFPQSAMDGYGIFLEEAIRPGKYRLKGEQQAGANHDFFLEADEAIRIFTGAKIPGNVNTVVQQEWVKKEADLIEITGSNIRKGMNIRPIASQNKKGELILPAGSPLYPASLALLAGVGIHQLIVCKKPKVILLNTGKELCMPGRPLQDGQIYESNSFALKQALKFLHIEVERTEIVDDDEDILAKAIGKALSECDLLLLTGGVSVGDHDYVLSASEKNGIEKVFHKVTQKPGKPLFFGKMNKKLVFGLPGNPASVLSCFYQYVYPAIRTMMGFAKTELPFLHLPLQNEYHKKSGLTHFLKARLSRTGVEILPQQESYKMNTFALADAMVEILADVEHIEKDALVKTYLLHTL